MRFHPFYGGPVPPFYEKFEFLRIRRAIQKKCRYKTLEFENILSDSLHLRKIRPFIAELGLFKVLNTSEVLKE